jgi:hypothetical protein
MKRGFLEAAAELDIDFDFPHMPRLIKEEQERVDRKRARDAQRRERGKQIVQQWYRDNPCTDCGNTDIRVLEADHVRGRNFTIGENLWRPIKEIQAELKLCESRCANCHRIRHQQDRQQSRELAVDELL